MKPRQPAVWHGANSCRMCILKDEETKLFSLFLFRKRFFNIYSAKNTKESGQDRIRPFQ